MEIKDLAPSEQLIQYNKIFQIDIEPLKKDLIFQWIGLVYHPRTPLDGITDFIKRKDVAAKDSGFPMSGEKFEEEYEKVLVGENYIVDRMVIEFLKGFNIPEFVRMRVYQEDLTNEYLALGNAKVKEGDEPAVSKTKADVRSKCLANIKVLEVGMKEAALEFMTGDDCRKQLMALYEEQSDSIHCPYAEIMAERIKDKVPPLEGWNVYM